MSDRSEPSGKARPVLHDFEAHSGPMQRESRQEWTALPAGAVDQPQVRQAPVFAISYTESSLPWTAFLTGVLVSAFNPDCPLGRAVMVKHFASGFSHSRQAHGEDYGRGARVERRRKMTARARVGPQSRLTIWIQAGTRDPAAQACRAEECYRPAAPAADGRIAVDHDNRWVMDIDRHIGRSALGAPPRR